MSRPPKESKADRFRRLAEARVNKLLAMFHLLGNLSGPGNYSYTQEQVEQIFSALQSALIDAKMRFYHSEKTGKWRFSLSEPYDSSEEKITKQSFAIQLPDGTFLRAVGYTGDAYPSINIYWDNGRNKPEENVCFVEYNTDREGDQSVCIAVYRKDKDDTVYYAPYVPEPKHWEVKKGMEDGKCYQYLVPKGTPVPGENDSPDTDFSMSGDAVLKAVRSLPHGGGVTG